MAERKLTGQYKTQLQRMARARLPRGRRGSIANLFRAAAEHLGTTWTGGKPTGYRLLEQFVASAPILKSVASYERTPKQLVTIDVNSDEFLASYAWRKLRMVVLKKRGGQCECCGFTAKDGVKIHVDHIKPRRKYPELALEETNLQVLCEVCNHGKGNWDETDWRQPADRFAPFWSKAVQ